MEPLSFPPIHHLDGLCEWTRFMFHGHNVFVESHYEKKRNGGNAHFQVKRVKEATKRDCRRHEKQR
jgi:hypothetical protein